jgi:exodeoxyribonuclease VII large subunit
MFRASARVLKFKPTDGMKLIVRGRVSVYDQRGDYQLLVEYLEPLGIGGLQIAFIQLKERLFKEGLFSESHKKPLPLLPHTVGVITSSTGAAIHDILNVLKRRFSNVHVLIRPVKVQGDGAAADIAEAIADFNKYQGVEVIIVGRGGGSMEDLWAFNEEIVARAIHASAIPIVTAIGHEVDFTISDFVADLRAPTPSAAAELVVRSKAEFQSELQALTLRLVNSIEQTLSRLRGSIREHLRGLKDPSLMIGHLYQRLDDLDRRLLLRMVSTLHGHQEHTQSLRVQLRMLTPLTRIKGAREKLRGLMSRMDSSMQRKLADAREEVSLFSGTLQAVSPLDTLARGYCIVWKFPEMKVIRDVEQIAHGNRVKIRFFKGEALATVE